MKTVTMLMMTVGCLALGIGRAHAQTPPGSPPSGETTPPPVAPPPMTSDTPTAMPITDPAPELRDPTAPPVPSGAAAPLSPTPATAPTPSPAPSVYPTWVARLGSGVLLGGGYEDFTNSGLKGMTSAGGAWNARLVTGMRQFVGLEAAYVGSARDISTLGVAGDTRLVSNGVEGALRLNVPIVATSRSVVEPFGFVGLGWQRYQMTNAPTPTSDIADRDDVLTLPYGAGLAYSLGMFMADARFTYRQTYMNDLLRSTGGRLNTWGFGAQAGVVF